MTTQQLRNTQEPQQNGSLSRLCPQSRRPAPASPTPSLSGAARCRPGGRAAVDSGRGLSSTMVSVALALSLLLVLLTGALFWRRRAAPGGGGGAAAAEAPRPVAKGATGGGGGGPAAAGAPLRKVTAAELARHNTEDDVWLAIDGRVYDFSSYIDLHPGGLALLNNAGGDATAGFHGDQHPLRVNDLVRARVGVGLGLWGVGGGGVATVHWGRPAGGGRWKRCRNGLGREMRLGLGGAGVAGLDQTAGQCWCRAARLWCGRAAPVDPAARSPAEATNAAVPVSRGKLLAWLLVCGFPCALLRAAGLVGLTGPSWGGDGSADYRLPGRGASTVAGRAARVRKRTSSALPSLYQEERPSAPARAAPPTPPLPATTPSVP